MNGWSIASEKLLIKVMNGSFCLCCAVNMIILLLRSISHMGLEMKNLCCM